MGSGAGQAQVHVLRRGACILDLPKVPHRAGRHIPGLQDLWHAPGPGGSPRSGQGHGGNHGSNSDLSEVQHGELAHSQLLRQVRGQTLKGNGGGAQSHQKLKVKDKLMGLKGDVS